MNDKIQYSPDIPIMLGIKEISEQFGITQHYARQLALSGTVKAVRVGRGKILINAQSVADFFDSNYITDSTATLKTNIIKPISVKL